MNSEETRDSAEGSFDDGEDDDDDDEGGIGSKVVTSAGGHIKISMKGDAAAPKSSLSKESTRDHDRIIHPRFTIDKTVEIDDDVDNLPVPSVDVNESDRSPSPLIKTVAMPMVPPSIPNSPPTSSRPGRTLQTLWEFRKDRQRPKGLLGLLRVQLVLSLRAVLLLVPTMALFAIMHTFADRVPILHVASVYGVLASFWQEVFQVDKGQGGSSDEEA
ncbi:hypothetical protein HDU97_006095 [Phlyctochytrium planicorne]|nr:hypothetical protein HDU97_006095 [Phlyctochytrium planicorne]